MLRIAHIQPFTLDLFGHDDAEWGREVRYFLPHLAFAQARAGDAPTVHLFTSGRPARREIDGVELRLHRCLQPPRRLDVTRRFARQVGPGPLWALREHPDVIHFHGALSLQPFMVLAAAAARVARVPMVAQDHGLRPVGRVEGMLGRLALAGTTRALASNTHHVEVLASRGAHGRIRLAPNGVDPVFGPDGPVVRPAGDRACILVVSRLWPDKDPLTMAAALAGLAARRPIHVTLAGTGPLRDEVVATLTRAGATVEHHDHLAQDALASRYRGADLLMLTSLREGFNQVTLEAMACGTPVIASDIPGIRDGVGDAGILLPPGDAPAFADAAEALLSDPARRSECSRRGIARAGEFGWDAIAARVREAYVDAIGAA